MKLAFDRASVRRTDVNGRLHVEVSNISAATVNPYFGREIPGAEALGLQPDKIYQLLRDPGELAKAASTFNNLPLLSEHVPVFADKPKKELVVGSTGTDAVFEAPYLRNSLVVWDAVAIAGIESGEQRELSCAYFYTPDMTPGVYEGAPYDGVMRDIRANHVALVEIGRAGPAVVVSDANPFIKTPSKEKPMKPTRKAVAVRAALRAVLRPLMAQDGAFDIAALVVNVKSATLAQDSARIIKGVQAKLPTVDAAMLADTIKMAADAEPDEPDEKKPATDEQGPDESDEDYKKRMEAKKAAEDEDDAKKDGDKKAAMDTAIARASTNARAAAIADMQAIRRAEKEVQPHIGEVAAMDSAAAVYRLALDNAKVDLTGVPEAAYGAMVRMLRKPGEVNVAPRIAQDAAAASKTAAQFPALARFNQA